ncbi:MAG: UDP-N-acetylmuramoyl-L-alanine--D-glutamate ligase, partial [Candidatus Omnitrophica bacterium]|nr:UDP-N-acetylmuramoyl-L-alanine--D-glutamate ligase [Candidatus Omnitrophota bacterium]
MNCTKQRITILGLGKSGFESARFLKKRGASVFASEQQSNPSTLERKKKLETLGIEVEIGQHTTNRILKSDLIVISPGISPKSQIYQAIENARVPLWSEIELAFRFLQARLIAVTGTNGKTTVTTLISKILKEQGHAVIS